jgi:PiT family inorganic phosphate transporter
MAVAWVITLPCAALVAAAMYGIATGIGGNPGLAIVGAIAIAMAAAVWLLSRRDPVNADNVNDVPVVALTTVEAELGTVARPVAGAGASA